jgi:hypothetical protein
MTDEKRPIRQISGNLQKFQAATRELRYVTVKVAICGDRSVSTNASAVSEANGTTVRVSLDLGVRFRYSRLKKAGRGCGGRGVLWELNRFRLGSHCRNRSYAKSPLLMLIDILLLSASEVIVTPNGQSVKTAQLGNSSDACVYPRGSVRRASGFVQTPISSRTLSL